MIEKTSAGIVKENRSERKRVLLIDDEPFMLKSLQRLLEVKHEVIAALGGDAAFKLLEEANGQFDAIICDLSMPGIGGVDLYRYIVKKYPKLEQRMIFMSGGAYTQQNKDFVASINNPQLEKPFSYEEILSTIEKVCQLK